MLCRQAYKDNYLMMCLNINAHNPLLQRHHILTVKYRLRHWEVKG